MEIGFIIPNFPNEKRVAILPRHLKKLNIKAYVENGFGKSIDIDDCEYHDAGAEITTREKIFSNCSVIFSLKLIQPSDYQMLQKKQMVIGWTHPTGSGKYFFESQAIPKELYIVDLDNIHPTVYHKTSKKQISWIPSNFIYQNSYLAGYASVLHALLSFGVLPDSSTKVALLSSGNTAQGAFMAISKFCADVRMFYRKTMHEFKSTLSDYDIIINGIEVDTEGGHILTVEEQSRIKKNCLIIDAAADADNAIEGTHYTSIDDPIYKNNNRFYYVVNNSPSILYRKASEVISESLAKYVLNNDVASLVNYF